MTSHTSLSKPGLRNGTSILALDSYRSRFTKGGKSCPIDDIVETYRPNRQVILDSNKRYKFFDTYIYANVSAKGNIVTRCSINRIKNPCGEGGIPGTIGKKNKCRNYNAKPDVGTINLIMIEGSGALDVVTDSVSLDAFAHNDVIVAEFLINGVMSGNVYRLDNSSG